MDLCIIFKKVCKRWLMKKRLHGRPNRLFKNAARALGWNFCGGVRSEFFSLGGKGFMGVCGAAALLRVCLGSSPGHYSAQTHPVCFLAGP